MARCKVEGIDDLLKALDGMADAEAIAQQMLTEAGEVLQNNIREAITEAANRGYATGELAASVIPGRPEKNEFGRYVIVQPVGQDSKGVRNGEKWEYLERGNGGSQEPHPFEDKAVEKAEAECQEKMQEAYDRFTGL